ncbi:hypothetical protein TeGR_g11652 [Tetraparma gracilis]|uniref:Bidirectional sugar transporter SWEET n=1 Tax=Tetraparma gracilis TaxID=2962635 RepID=A0ABQ6MU17_9STRA|nr:hypothetical protein TeGR_g11652 [Tetraparma gracilis]
MAADDSLMVTLLGNLGLFGACVLFLSPIPTMLRIIRSKATLSFSPDPYLMSVANCFFWVFYALPSVTPDRTSPLITNLIGAVINTAYVGVFMYHAPGGVFWKKFWGLLFFVVFVGCMVFFVVPENRSWFNLSEDKTDAEIRSDMLGFVADVFNIGMYGGPLTIINTVIRTKSVEFMPLPLTVGTSLCSFTWLAYGACVGDWFILIPNGGGAIFCVAQIVLYCTYCGTDESKAAFERVKKERAAQGTGEQREATPADPLLYKA